MRRRIAFNRLPPHHSDLPGYKVFHSLRHLGEVYRQSAREWQAYPPGWSLPIGTYATRREAAAQLAKHTRSTK